MNKRIAQCILAVSCVFCFCSASSAKPKKPSGIYGSTLFHDNTPLPDNPGMFYISNCEVVVEDARTSKVVKRAHSNWGCTFKITLPPGKYTVYPIYYDDKNPYRDFTNCCITEHHEVTVWKGFYSIVDAAFNIGL